MLATALRATVQRRPSAYNRGTVDERDLWRTGKAMLLGAVLGAILALLARSRADGIAD